MVGGGRGGRGERRGAGEHKPGHTTSVALIRRSGLVGARLHAPAATGGSPSLPGGGGGGGAGASGALALRSVAACSGSLRLARISEMAWMVLPALTTRWGTGMRRAVSLNSLLLTAPCVIGEP